MREIGAKCNKGAVNGLGLSVKKENEKWPMRQEGTEGILWQRKRCRDGWMEGLRLEIGSYCSITLSIWENEDLL